MVASFIGIISIISNKNGWVGLRVYVFCAGWLFVHVLCGHLLCEFTGLFVCVCVCVCSVEMTISESGSFVLAASNSMICGENSVGKIPNVLSQLNEEDAPIFAGQLETVDGQIMPFTIGKTDIGNGRPRPFIHLSDHPSIANRHVTITTVQTRDGKFRVSLRQNHPQCTVMLGGSVIRPNVSYPVTDDDEITLGDGLVFKLRVHNNQPRPRASIMGGRTPFYVASPDSENSYEIEQQAKMQKRREYSEKIPTPPELTDDPSDSFLLQLVADSEEDEQSLVHRPLDTCPFTDTSRSQETQPQATVVPTQPQMDEAMNECNDPVCMYDEENDQVGNVEMNRSRGSNIEAASDRSQGSNIEAERVGHDQTGGDQANSEQADGDQPSSDGVGDGHADGDGVNDDQAYSEQADSDVADGEQADDDQAESDQNAGNDVMKARAPELSQDDAPLMERVQRRLSKRQADDESGSAKRSRRMVTPDVTPVRTSRSGRHSLDNDRESLFVGGSKKLVILKTCVEIEKALEISGCKMETKWSDKVEALVTSKIVRTTKFLCAINKGLAIFPKSVLTEAKGFKSLPRLNEPSLWLQDPDGEAKYEFSLQASIERARKRPLFRNFEIYFYKNGIGEFSTEEFRDLITSAGGKVVGKLLKCEPGSQCVPDGGLIVIGTESNKTAAKSFGIEFIHKIEFIVESCMKQKLDFKYAQIKV